LGNCYFIKINRFCHCNILMYCPSLTLVVDSVFILFQVISISIFSCKILIISITPTDACYTQAFLYFAIHLFCYKFNSHFVALRCTIPLYVGSSGSRQITVFGWWFFSFINAESSRSRVLSSRIVRQT